MKAIETVYNGYKFRSRLEARWAVFFDEVGVEYQYEPEGFELHYMGRYLPDFYLPKFEAYIEIKPMPAFKPVRRLECVDIDAAKKILELSWSSKSWAILIFGDPLDHRGCWFYNGHLEYPASALGFDDRLMPEFYEGEEVFALSFENRPTTVLAEYLVHRKEAMAARQARFEHMS